MAGADILILQQIFTRDINFSNIFFFVRAANIKMSFWHLFETNYLSFQNLNIKQNE
jgi:hypothetical protein